MNTDAWFPCYPSDLVGDTEHLSNHDFGAYWRLLCWYYCKGPPPDNDECLRSIMRVDLNNWPQTKSNVMAFFNINGDGKWHQKRADQIIFERDVMITKRRAQTSAARALNPKHHPFVTNIVTNPVTNPVTGIVQTPLDLPTNTDLPANCPDNGQNEPKLFVTNPVTNIVTTSVTNPVTAVQPQPQPQVQKEPPLPPKISSSAQAVLNSKELDRIEEKLKTIREQGTQVAGSPMKYSTTQISQLESLKLRRKQLIASLGFTA